MICSLISVVLCFSAVCCIDFLPFWMELLFLSLFFVFLFMHCCSVFGCCVNNRNQIIEFSQVFMIGDLSEGSVQIKLNMELHFKKKSI